MTNLSRVRLLLVLSCLTLVWHGAPVAAQDREAIDPDPDFAGQVLWLDADTDHAVFLPAEAFMEKSLEELPLSWSDQEILKTTVERFHDNERGLCDRPQDRPQQGTSPDAGGFEDILGEAEIVFEGTVVDVVDGWSPWTNRISRIAYVRVDSVFKGAQSEGAPAEGQTRAVMFPGGRVIVNGTVLCADPLPGLYVPRIDEKMLVSGSSWPGDERFFDAAAKFPIIGDGIASQAYATLKADQVFMSLEDVQRSLRPERRQEENHE